MSMHLHLQAALALALSTVALLGCNAAPASEHSPETAPEAAKVADSANEQAVVGIPAPAKAPPEPSPPTVKRLLTFLYSAAGNRPGLPESHGLVQTAAESTRQLVEETLAYTAESGETAVIVDKRGYRLFLVQQGAVTAGYPVELGANPVDDKRMEGDMTTPEGLYHVVEKRDHGQTKYYRGFLLDYPNATDHAEFRRLKRNAELPADATIGGGIMLHGLGSGMAPGTGGENWTHGCVALSNDDMDAVFPFIEEGTRVVIVSAASL